MQGGIRVGNLLGIPFYIDYSWFPIALLFTFFYALDLKGLEPTLSPIATVFGGGILALGLFGSILGHELAHSLVAISLGMKVKAVMLFVFGGVAAIEKDAPHARGAFWIALAGPLFNLSLFWLITAVVAIQMIPSESLAIQMLLRLGQVNLIVGIFNLLPGLPLDGGQMLKAVVWGLTGERRKGILWAATTGQWLGWGLMGLGIWGMFQGDFFSGLWLVLIGLFIANNARNYGQYNQMQHTLSALKAGEVMTRNFRVLDLGMSLREFVDRFVVSEHLHALEEDREDPNSAAHEAYFAEADGRYKGLIKTEKLSHIERSQWDRLNLSEILLPMEELCSVSEDTTVAEVIALMNQQHLRQIPVLTPTGAVAGLIDKGDIVAGLAKQMGLVVPSELLHQIRTSNEFPPGFRIEEPPHPQESHSVQPSRESPPPT